MSREHSAHALAERIPHLERTGNRILSALSPDVYQRLAPYLESTPLASRQRLITPRVPVDTVYFLERGICSVVALMRSGAAAEVGTIGNEGVVGAMLLVDGAIEPYEYIVQVPGQGLRLPSAIFRSELARLGTLHRLVGLYVHAHLIDVMRLAACSRLHSLEERTCRWLLMAHDRTQRNPIHLTQEFLSLMLGARRPSVTFVARKLQAAGLIRYTRGSITVLNRAGLKARSCECYEAANRNFSNMTKAFRSPALSTVSQRTDVRGAYSYDLAPMTTVPGEPAHVQRIRHLLDGKEIEAPGGRWRVEVAGVHATPLAQWIQLVLTGHTTHSLVVKVSESSDTTSVVPAIRAWLENPGAGPRVLDLDAAT